ncbi:CTP synthetase [Roseovarius spongiae]|uniref:CTP synthetase n=1 Tax=Roseovarius spongiae TaxID=2320272 RepID=A0A3A8BAY9_9RHOB|nr:CTP synthetase [Roseovarius spongiae]RKF16444.1 CTP synthetase [Roseovarius spongiae]
MLWLTFVVHLFVGTTLAGIGVIAALVAGFTGSGGVVWGAVIGYLFSLPVAFLVARQLWRNK